MHRLAGKLTPAPVIFSGQVEISWLVVINLKLDLALASAVNLLEIGRND